MSMPVVATILFAALFGLILLGLPVAYSLGLSGIIGLFASEGGDIWATLTGGAMQHHMASFSLLALPLFILMSSYISQSGMGPDLVNFFTKWLHRMPGYLHSASIAVCGLFSAMCGSSVATAATIGSIVFPEMRRMGHSMRIGMGAVAAGGTLGIVIPPSNQFLLYGVLTETSVTQLFMAGIIPGILLVLLFIGITTVMVLRHPELAPQSPTVPTWAEKISSLRKIWTTAALIFCVLGSMFMGLATPTEAAAIGAFGALLLGMFVTRRLNLATAHAAAIKTAQTVTMIGFIIMGGLLLGRAITLLDLSSSLIAWIAESELDRWTVMLLINVLLLFLGMLMDGAAVVMISAPLLFPIVMDLGFDPVWFGVVFCLNVELSLITPPVGMILFVIQGLTGEPMAEVLKGVFPYALGMVFMLALVMAFPELCLWLPRMWS